MAATLFKDLKFIGSDLLRILDREAHFFTATPYAATLFLTYRCNSRCKACTMWKRPQLELKKKEIGINEWKLIVDQLVQHGVRIVELFGGNVLIRKDLLIAILRYLKEKGCIVHLATNQLGLDDEIAQTMVECIDTVYISTDGVNEYQDLLRGQRGAFQRAEMAITKLLKFRKESKKPRLVCNTTVSKYNLDILEKLVEYAIAHTFDEIHFEYVGEFTQEHLDRSMIDGLEPTPFFIKQDESVLVNEPSAKQLKKNLEQIRKTYRGKGIRIITINIDVLSKKNLHQGTIPHSKCYLERTDVTVDPAGNVIACPFVQEYTMGNLMESSFEEIWNNIKHRRFRKLQNRKKLYMCRHCILGVEYNLGFLKSLQRLYLLKVKPMLSLSAISHT